MTEVFEYYNLFSKVDQVKPWNAVAIDQDLTTKRNMITKVH